MSKVGGVAARVRTAGCDRWVAYNESVTASLRRLDEDDDLTFDDDSRVGAVLLSYISTQRDGAARSGRASDVIRSIAAWADDKAETIVLVPAGSGALRGGELRAWYERNGFELQPDGVMMRAPR